MNNGKKFVKLSLFCLIFKISMIFVDLKNYPFAVRFC